MPAKRSRKQTRAREDVPPPDPLQQGWPARAYRWAPLGVGVLSGALALALYLGTLAPTVTFADAGELAAAVHFLDVAHAPGFPLYLLLGKLFTLLVPWGRVVQRLNAFSAVCAAAAVGLFAGALAIGLALRRRRPVAPAVNGLFPLWAGLLALAGAGLLATSRTFWEQATLTEVYALNMALAAGLLLLLVLYLRARDQDDQRRADRCAAGAALLAGLGLGGHLTLLFIVGAVFLAVCVEELIRFGQWKRDSHLRSGSAWREIGQVLEFFRWRRLLLWSGLFLLGLCVYLYLPLRASASPPFDWGGVTTLTRFWRQVSGKQYQVNFAPGPATWQKQLGFFLPRLWAEFTPLALLLAPLGLYRLFRQRWALAWGSLAGAAVVLFYGLSYEIAEDQETYFLLFFLLAALWMAYGMAQLVEWSAAGLSRRPAGRARRRSHAAPAGAVSTAPRQGPPGTSPGGAPSSSRERIASWWKRRLPLLLAALCVLLAAWPLLAHFPLCDRRAYTYAEAYARDVLANLPPDALVLTRDWNLFSPAYYLQHVEQVRPDVVFVDQELLRRTWYLETLQRQFPWLMDGAGQALAAYREELVKFEEGRPYEAATIQARFQELGNALLTVALNQGRPAFVTGEVEYAYPTTIADRYLAMYGGGRPSSTGGVGVGDGTSWVPQALAIRLATAPLGALPEEVLVQPALGDGRYHDELTLKTVDKYARFWLWRGLYLQATVGCAAAVPAYERALAIDPALEQAQAGLAACGP